MSLINNDKYQSPDISGKENEVKVKVDNYVESVKGSTVEEQRQNLPLIMRYKLQDCVDYVMNNLPDGVERVDGVIIKPILVEVCNEKINELPAEEPMEA